MDRGTLTLAGLCLLLFLLLILSSAASVAQESPEAVPLQRGSEGQAVETLQENLAELGFYDGPLNGRFGPLTEGALKAFQAARGLERDGIYGPETRQALLADLERKRQPAAPALASIDLPDLPTFSPGPAGPVKARDRGFVVLTFHDGPDPELQPLILAALKRYEARASFFFTAEDMKKASRWVKATSAAGHPVENHGRRHEEMARLTPAEQARRITETAALIRELTGRPSRFFRPPFGGMDPRLLRSAALAGHRVIFWSNVAVPDLPGSDPEQLAEELAGMAYNGAVFMLHATEPSTVEALPRLLQALQARGFAVLPLDALLSVEKRQDLAK